MNVRANAHVVCVCIYIVFSKLIPVLSVKLVISSMTAKHNHVF